MGENDPSSGDKTIDGVTQMLEVEIIFKNINENIVKQKLQKEPNSYENYLKFKS